MNSLGGCSSLRWLICSSCYPLPHLTRCCIVELQPFRARRLIPVLNHLIHTGAGEVAHTTNVDSSLCVLHRRMLFHVPDKVSHIEDVAWAERTASIWKKSQIVVGRLSSLMHYLQLIQICLLINRAKVAFLSGAFSRCAAGFPLFRCSLFAHSSRTDGAVCASAVPIPAATRTVVLGP
ncbi:hypothetical protein PFISCL1PPCAC_4392, partial [Pristionchus fissidentatus]